MLISLDGASTGSGRKRATLAIPKMVEQAPMPSAEDSTATAVKPGCLRNVRAAKETSCATSLIQRAIQTARDSSILCSEFPNSRWALLRASRSVIPASVRSATFIAI